MIRRLVAAAGLATVLAGLSVAVAVPASAGEHDNSLCITLEDQRTPGAGDYFCLKDYLPGGDIRPGGILHGTPNVSLPPHL
jgi:hypothetical protein